MAADLEQMPITLGEWYRLIQGAVDVAREGNAIQLFAPWTIPNLRLVWIDRLGRVWRLNDQDVLMRTEGLPVAIPGRAVVSGPRAALAGASRCSGDTQDP